MWFVVCLFSAIALSAPATRPATRPNTIGEMPIGQVEWEGVYGRLKNGDKGPLLLLMARGFMGIPHLSGPAFDDSTDQQVSAWMKAHPNAKVIPVRMIPFSEEGGPIYCWVVDGKDNLNLHLVRQGCSPADGMTLPEGREDVLVPRQQYDEFTQQCQAAELDAIDAERGIWAGEQAATARHWQKGGHLERQGKLKEAVQEFERAMEKDEQLAVGWCRIARCHDKLGNHQAALAAFDKAIEFDKTPGEPACAKYLTYWQKAESIAKHEGVDKAADMFKGLIGQAPDDLELHRLLSMLYGTHDQPKLAAETLEKGIARFLAKRRIEIDKDNRIVLDEARIKNETGAMGGDDYWGDVQGLVTSLVQMGQICLRTREFDRAMKYATMGLSIRQRPAGATWDKPELAQAGDAECRLIRARVFIEQKSFEQAKAEIDLAKLVADTGLAGSFAVQDVNAAYAALQTAFPDKKVVVPAADATPSRAQ